MGSRLHETTNDKENDMQEILAEWADDEGNEYLLLSDPPGDGYDPRNAVPRPRPGSPGSPGEVHGRVVRRTPRPSQGIQGTPPVRQPTSQAPRQALQPRAQVHIVQAPGAISIPTGKVLRFVEVLGETVAELIPLPDAPPPPTGRLEMDLQNQNEHRQALHAHRVLTSRVRTGGRVIAKVMRLLTQE
jgi:hypothetical protein